MFTCISVAFIYLQSPSFPCCQYKSNYDLLERAAPSAGPSRSTRRAHSQRVFDLITSSPVSQKNSISAKAARAPPPGPQIPSVLSVKAKGKQKAVNPPSTIDTSTRTPLDSDVFAQNGKARPQPRLIALNPLPLDDVPQSVSAITRTQKRSSLSMTSPTVPSVPRKKRKSVFGLEESIGSTSVSHSSSFGTDSLEKSLARTSSIKRIRLIVRKPPPSYSNPRQKPPPPKFNSSVSDFLSSYTMLDDQDQTPEALDALAQKEAALREKAARLHQQGRFPPARVPPTSTSGKSTPILNPNMRDPRRSQDAWEHIVQTIVQRGRHGGQVVRGRNVASQVASRIQVYWDQSAMREDRAKAQEEKRVRALAKATVKMVVSEWKKAVFYIREQQRLRAQAEEMRRGHEHLDAILDQSGQILETQQVDLAKGEESRSRSRSSSVRWERESAESSEEDEDNEEEGSAAEASADEFADVQMDEEGVEVGAGPGDDEDEAASRDEDESNEDDSSDEEDAGATLALLGMLHDQKDHLTTADNTPLASTPEHMDTDSVVREAVNARSASELSIDHRAVPEPAMASPSAPSDMDSTARTPTFGDAQSPVLDSFYDYPMRDTPSPASSVIEHETASNLKGGDVPDSDSDAAARTALSASNADSSVLGPEKVSSPAVDTEETVANSKEDRVDGGSLYPSAESAPEDGVLFKAQATDEPMEDIESEEFAPIPEYLKPFAIAPVDWSPEEKVTPPLLLRGVLRPYQQAGLEWLASLHSNNLNGILADEMGLGKTIQTIALLAHLACDRGIWGPHLIIVPTSVLLNWEMEFKKFLPGFKILSYHGTTKRRKELRQGWYNKHHFNVCITSYTLASRDAHIFKRKMWYYMVLDEAHMIKNFKSQRWNILLMFRSFRRLLLTGTPLQNNLTELWALLQFLMSGTNFANLKEFGEWFSTIEMGTALDDENLQRVSKLHTVLRPYLLRRLKRDVEKELPSKYEHLVLCPLSKRQRFLYDEFMSRAHTREALQSGIYQKIANILMQLRKVCNHPDLFEVRPVVTSFAMARSAVVDFEIKELLVRRQLLRIEDEDKVNFDLLGLRFVDQQDVPLISALETRRLDATHRLPLTSEIPGEPPPKDTRTIAGYRAWRAYQQRAQKVARWAQIGYVNGLRCARTPIYGQELLRAVKESRHAVLPLSAIDRRTSYMDTVTIANAMVKSYEQRAEELSSVVDKFAFATPAVVALDLPRMVLSGCEDTVMSCPLTFDKVLHRASTKLQVAFPDPSLLQYDCGKLQELSRLLRQRKAGGHRILIFTQMTKILDILEIFLNFHGYLYLRLDGATKIEDRQYITERFNADERIFCFIASSRSGGVGINLTGADTVIFYDSDFNPQMDRQCEDRAHRIGQIRDVHIYRFISSHTVEEAMLMKANQKRSLDDLVIQKGEFDWRTLFEDDGALTKALGEFEDTEDAQAAAIAAREADVLEGADKADFGAEGDVDVVESQPRGEADAGVQGDGDAEDADHGEDAEGGSISDYMISFVRVDYGFFRDWRL
ncbi:SNF2 family N-terminal domain-containing protein [Melanogaster broomeanus]|nr:SNF2 family N-terminal domain-containing protein [Melanogaster broomeanus]